MSENTKAFIDNLEAGNNADAGEAFKSALRDKMGDALDAKRQELAANLFNGKLRHNQLVTLNQKLLNQVHLHKMAKYRQVLIWQMTVKLR